MVDRHLKGQDNSNGSIMLRLKTYIITSLNTMMRRDRYRMITTARISSNEEGD